VIQSGRSSSERRWMSVREETSSSSDCAKANACLCNNIDYAQYRKL